MDLTGRMVHCIDQTWERYSNVTRNSKKTWVSPFTWCQVNHQIISELNRTFSIFFEQTLNVKNTEHERFRKFFEWSLENFAKMNKKQPTECFKGWFTYALIFLHFRRGGRQNWFWKPCYNTCVPCLEYKALVRTLTRRLLV